MIEIKFRAWDKERKRMHDVLVIRFEHHKYTRIIFREEHLNSSCDGYENEWQYTNKTCLMQYTGLKDINGVDIYEGDILKDEYNRILLVEWWKCRFMFRALTETNFIRADIIQWFEGDTALPTIVSNSYENPELMEPEYKS